MTRKQAFMTVIIAAFILAANRPATQSTAIFGYADGVATQTEISSSWGR